MTYDARDELTGTTDSVTTASSSYDYTPRGTTSQVSTVSATGATATTNYAADAFGQQTSAGQAAYTYDALGRLTSRASGTSTTNLAYSGTANDVASDGTNTYSRDPSGDLVGTADSAAGTSSLLWTDEHTDVVGEFSADSTSLSGVETYSPTGEVTSSTGTAGTVTLGYQSEWTDGTTGDVNMASRWYNPTTGQFTSTDTVDNSAVPDTADANPFAYGGDNPLDGTDPTGHMFAVNYNGVEVIGSMQYVNEELDVLAFNSQVVQKVPNATVEQLVSADNAYRKAQVDASSVADAEAKPVRVGTGHLIIGPDGTIGSAAYLNIHYAQVQLLQDENTIDNLIAQDAKADTDNTQTCNGNPLTWGGCAHNAAAWVGNNAVVREVVSAAAGVVVAGTCLAATEGAGSVGCMALGGAAANGANYALESAATGHGSLTGFVVSMAVGAVAGASAAMAATAVGGLVVGAFGDSALGAAAADTVTGVAAGSVGGGAGGGGNYLAGCGSSCSFSGLAEATGESALYGGATGGALGATASLAASASSAAADDTAAVSDNAEDEGSCPTTVHSFAGDTGVLLANGSVKPIDQIKVGDDIENSAPGKSGTQVHKVDAVIVTHTDHDFVNVTIKPTAAAAAATITTDAAPATTADTPITKAAATSATKLIPTWPRAP